jgi:hypothetical protein
MAARARKDTRRYWEFARCYWSKELGLDISEIGLPTNTWELEQKFWSHNVGCCNVCHTDPLHGMRLVELPCCG